MKMKQYIGCALYMIAKHLPVSYGKFGGLWKSCRGGNKIDASQMRG